jgi:2',3'-cyclic-nucleotide 2'-phosphodiesterase (5'-nucleotidase family)
MEMALRQGAKGSRNGFTGNCGVISFRIAGSKFVYKLILQIAIERSNIMKKWVVFILMAFVSLFCCSSQNRIFDLTILFSNDIHGDVYAFARQATYDSQVRSEGISNILLLDSGDYYARGPYEKKYQGEIEIAEMNYLKYDAMVLGNNDFNGADSKAAENILFARINQAGFPILGANIYLSENPLGQHVVPGIKPYVLKRFDDINIVIIGLTTDTINTKSTAKAFWFDDPDKSLKEQTKDIDEKDSIVIVLSHMGIVKDKRIAAGNRIVKAIIGGHDHADLVNEKYGKSEVPIVQTNGNGRYFGRLDLRFEYLEDRWQLAKGESTYTPQKTYDRDIKVEEIINSFIGK